LPATDWRIGGYPCALMQRLGLVARRYFRQHHWRILATLENG
jgi:hypothetical protein